MRYIYKVLTALMIFLVATTSTASAADKVDLFLLIDGSGSINNTEFNLQQQGLADAINNSTIVPQDGSVSICVIQFSTNAQLELSPTTINNQSDADNISSAIMNMNQLDGWTNIGAAINLAVSVAQLNPNINLSSERQIIDISTDGVPNRPIYFGINRGIFWALNRRDNANASGFEELNAVGVGDGINETFMKELVYPQPWNNSPGFYLYASNFTDFQDEIEQKIIREVANPQINIEKTTNGHDADNATGPEIEVGGDVLWNYTVTNTGDVNLTNVSVTDSIPGVNPIYVSGNTSNDEFLNTSETWLYTATGTADEGLYSNIGNVTAQYLSVNVSAEDSSHYLGINASIDIEKTTNGYDADNATGPEIEVDDSVLWEYVVTNTGNVNLSNVVVNDSVEGNLTLISGDTNDDEVLNLTETWYYNATDTAKQDQYSNIGNVTAQYLGNITINVTDEDESHYFGANASIDIEKYTEGLDADSAPGPLVLVGDSITWTYNITNTGNVNLTNVTVTDDKIGLIGMIPLLVPDESQELTNSSIAEPGNYMNNATAEGQPTVGDNATDQDSSHYSGYNASLGDLVWEDLNGDGIQDAGEPGIDDVTVNLYYCNNTSIATTSTNVNGFYLFDSLLTDNYYVEFVKPSGYEYTLKDQGGDDTLDSDANTTNGQTICTLLGPLESNRDFDAGFYKPASISDFVWNDTNYNGIQDVGESGISDINVSLYNCSDDSLIAQTSTNATGYYNFSVAPGNYYLEFQLPDNCVFSPHDQGGDDTVDSDVNPTTNQTDCITLESGENDPNWDVGILEVNASISIEKLTNGVDVNDPTELYLLVGGDVNWTYNITNTGNVPLTNIMVTDNKSVTINCSQNTLNPDEFMICTANGTAETGPYSNLGNVTAEFNGLNVSDDDESHYFGANASIDIEKYTQGQDADSSPGPLIPVGNLVTWTYNVTNTGNVNLTNVKVTDDKIGLIGVIPLLTPNESQELTNSSFAGENEYSNNATAEGQPPVGSNVTDQDSSYYFGANASIDIEKYTEGIDADASPGPIIPVGNTVTWWYNVTNTGNLNLTNVTIMDNNTGFNYTCALLEPGEWCNVTNTSIAIENQYSNIGNVTAQYNGFDVNDSDESHYFGANASIDIEKYTNGVDADAAPGTIVTAGDTVTWWYNVTNTGNVDLTNVTIMDNRTGFTHDCGTLAPGEWCNVTNTDTAIEGQYSNLGNVTAHYNGFNVTDEDSSHYFGEEQFIPNPQIEIEKYTEGVDADTGPGPMILVGDTVTWWYNVTNTGNVDLTNVTIMDNRTGFTHDCGTLAPGEWCNVTNTSIAIKGQYSNLGNVTCKYNSFDVIDEDKSYYFGADASIDIEKYTQGQDADISLGSPMIPVGGEVTWLYNITNTGNVNLTNVNVTDDKIGSICTVPIIQPGETKTCNVTGTAMEGLYTNNATAVGQFNGFEVSDSDSSHYRGYTGHQCPAFEVPTANPLFLIGGLGIAIVLSLRRKHR